MYASTQNKREWLHVLDHCEAIDLVLREGRAGETYNVGSGVEATIEEIADRVLELTGKPASLKKIVPDRPGHDRRYLLDATKIAQELGWAPSRGFEDGLRGDRRLVRGEPRLVGAAQRARAGRRICLEIDRFAQGAGAIGREQRQTANAAELPWSPRARTRRRNRPRPHRHRRIRVGTADATLVLRRGGLRRLRTRLRARRRDEPVRRVRPGARRPHVRPDPRPLLHGHRAREGGQEGAARAPRRRSSRGDDLVEPCRSPPSTRRERRIRLPKGPLTLRPDLSIPSEAGPARGDPAARLSARQEGTARARRAPLPRQARARPAGRVPARRERRRARELPPGRRRGRGAVQLARRGAEGPGGRRPLVRAREPRQGQAVRPLLGRAQPGVPRRRGREAVDDEGRDRHGRGRSSSTAGRSRRRTTSRRREARRRAQPTCSGSACRTSCRGPIRGTRSRRTTAGARCCSARGRCRRSSAPRRGSPTSGATRRRPGASAPSRVETTAGLASRCLPRSFAPRSACARRG